MELAAVFANALVRMIRAFGADVRVAKLGRTLPRLTHGEGVLLDHTVVVLERSNDLSGHDPLFERLGF